MAARIDPSFEAQRIKLPGFGLPYNTWGDTDDGDIPKSLSAVMWWTHDVLTVRERCMLVFMNQITDKPGWYHKVHDEEIVAKWKQEAQEVDWKIFNLEHGDMSHKMFKYCIDELRAKAEVYQKNGIVSVLDATSCVLKSDTIVPPELKEELRRLVAPLEDVPGYQKDWHPGSDEKVLNLVHPSLFPIIYQRSRILPDSTIGIEDCLASIGKGEIVPDPLLLRSKKSSNIWSTRFQWLPCDVQLMDGDDAKILSYINNLHPVDHKPLYGVIEKIITKVVPLWNIVYQCHQDGKLRTHPRINCSTVEYELPPNTEEDPPEDFDGDENEFYENLGAMRIYTRPEPGQFDALDFTTEHIEKRCAFIAAGEQKIQVIVKLANIHLTPEKPEYDGGAWHIEGQLNEHIVSTAIYYYDNENVTDSYLSFRTKVNAEDFCQDLGYEQNDWRGVDKLFGVSNDEANIQELGSVLTREDRLIAFPNGFQHRVGRFKLKDPLKPGHRKILALFLVAPTLPIISTANVPPQQREWWLREVKTGGSKVSDLPAELIEMIGDSVEDFPIGLKDAKQIREELIAERGKMDQAVDHYMADYSFSFCEH